MNDMNRLLIFLLLAGLLYALYKYQYIIFGSNNTKPEKLVQKQSNQNNKLIYERKKQNIEKVSADNISQLTIGSLEDEDGNPEKAYKQDSILGSLDSMSLFSNMTNNSNATENSGISKNDSLFF
jgi:hypothetical protein